MNNDQSQPDIERLVTDAARTIALLDLIIKRDDPEAIRLAAERAAESYDDLLRRRGGVQLSEPEAALFQAMMDRLRALLRFLNSKR